MAPDYRKRKPPQEAADFIGVAKTTLESWRFYGKGPAYLKVGGKVFYLESDLIAFMEAGRVLPEETTSQKGITLRG